MRSWRMKRFRRMFSGDLDVATGPMRPWGWATGYALSIYGTEYILRGARSALGTVTAMAVRCRFLKGCSAVAAGRCS